MRELSALQVAMCYYFTLKVVNVHITSLQVTDPSVETEILSGMKHSVIVEDDQISRLKLKGLCDGKVLQE